jgi:hypothetical protein
MARKRKQKDLEEAIDESVQTEKRINSELTEDERRALLFQHVKTFEERLAAKKKADADFKNACKVAKSELGKDAVADIKDVISLKTPEGEAALKAEVERKLRIARFMNAPVGHQFTFSDDMRPSVDRAYEDGKIVGLDGGDMRPPHDPSVPQYASWLEGWHAGQAVNASGFRQKINTEPVEGSRSHVDTSDVPFTPPLDDPMPAQPAMPA